MTLLVLVPEVLLVSGRGREAARERSKGKSAASGRNMLGQDLCDNIILILLPYAYIQTRRTNSNRGYDEYKYIYYRSERSFLREHSLEEKLGDCAYNEGEQRKNALPFQTEKFQRRTLSVLLSLFGHDGQSFRLQKIFADKAEISTDTYAIRYPTTCLYLPCLTVCSMILPVFYLV